MTDSIHAALFEWFSHCETIKKLFFNFSTSTDSDTMISTSGDTLVEQYIDGSQKRRYAFELNHFVPFTTAQNDSGNVEMMETVDAITEWVEEQNAAGNFPAFPAGRCPESVSLLDEYAGYVVSQDANTARYMIPFAIEYMKG